MERMSFVVIPVDSVMAGMFKPSRIRELEHLPHHRGSPITDICKEAKIPQGLLRCAQTTFPSGEQITKIFSTGIHILCAGDAAVSDARQVVVEGVGFFLGKISHEM